MSTEQMQNTNMDGQENTAAEADVSMERYLTFRSDGTTMGVSTDYVIEILTDQIITEIPMVPEFITIMVIYQGNHQYARPDCADYRYAVKDGKVCRQYGYHLHHRIGD